MALERENCTGGAASTSYQSSQPCSVYQQVHSKVHFTSLCGKFKEQM